MNYPSLCEAHSITLIYLQFVIIIINIIIIECYLLIPHDSVHQWLWTAQQSWWVCGELCPQHFYMKGTKETNIIWTDSK